MAQAAAPALTQNILREGLILSRTPDPAVMVIFGASGDLTARKLMPALYNLALNRYLPSGFSVIGVADTALSEEEFRSNMADAVRRFSRTQPVDRAGEVGEREEDRDRAEERADVRPRQHASERADVDETLVGASTRRRCLSHRAPPFSRGGRPGGRPPRLVA